ncbi:MAG: KUP/HAK/KT family potassium transporter [Vulcanimicrobiaceae bacterium]
MPERRESLPLTIAALGVVFGDIGTSPLYTLRACFQFSGAKPVREDVLGICSLLVLALVVVVCIKYIAFIMRVDHDGEGGILALLALASKPLPGGHVVAAGTLTFIVVVGASMLFGDGIITPAISVISAIEGIGVISPSLHQWIVPLSVLVLVALFAIQVRGTERVGRLFGPVMVAWFVAIGIAGGVAIVNGPQVLAALDPRHGVAFIVRHGLGGFLVLGGVVLAVTGVEALYADLSHFGRRPIVRAWYGLVFPALVLAYLGQGAHLIADPRSLLNPFYALTPGWTLVPMVTLATLATVIASQALISGAFTLVAQAIALGLSPRMEVRHTSRRVYGQVYVPSVTAALAVCSTLLVVAFRSSDQLAAAYGLAVAVTMLTTSLAYYAVVRRALRWRRAVALPLVALFLFVDGSFVLAGLPKFQDGGWLPIAISVTLTTIAFTWLEGRRRLLIALERDQTPVEDVIRHLVPSNGKPSATMVFLTPDPNGVPFLRHHLWIRDRAREERIVTLHLVPIRKPYLDAIERVRVERLAPRFVRVQARYGYMEPLRLEPILRACAAQGLQIKRDETSFFFYSNPKIEAAERGLPRWQRWLFKILQRNSRPLPDDLGIHAENRVELGVTVAI